MKAPVALSSDARPPRRADRRIGTVLYAPNSEKSRVLARFAETLRTRGWRVGGVIIDTLWDEAERKIGLDLVSAADGTRRPYARPNTEGLAIGRWILDPETLDWGATLLEESRERERDLVVVDKFGPLEARGMGLATPLRRLLAKGPPVLVAARSEFLDAWDGFARAALADPVASTALLRPSDDALWRWWGSDTLYDDLIAGVLDRPVDTVRRGRHWLAVSAGGGVGLAHVSTQEAATGSTSGGSLLALARGARSWNPSEAALGIAAINAHYNHPDRHPINDGPRVNGLDLIAGLPGRAVIVGRFPDLSRRVPEALVIERDPGPGDLPEAAAEPTLATADRVAITASTLTNGTAPRLLEAARGAAVALVGPGTPLTPRLFDHGATILSGLVLDDPEAALAAVAADAGARDLMRIGRMRTMLAANQAR